MIFHLFIIHFAYSGETFSYFQYLFQEFSHFKGHNSRSIGGINVKNKLDHPFVLVNILYQNLKIFDQGKLHATFEHGNL